MKHALRLFFCLAPLLLRAQAPEPARLLPLVQHYGVEQGLSNRFVRDVFQDRRGFVWLSTHFGLNRFDGHAFAAYTAQSHGLRSNVIAAVREDPDGWLWVFQLENAQVRHLQLLDPRSGRVQSFEAHFPGRRLPFRLADLVLPRGWLDLNALFTRPGRHYRYLGGGRFAAAFPNLPVPDLVQPTDRGTLLASGSDAAGRYREFDAAGRLLNPNTPPPPAHPLHPGRAFWLDGLLGTPQAVHRFRDARRGRDWHLDPAARRLAVYRPDGSLLHDFSPQLSQFEGWQSLYCLLLDGTGSLWLATSEGVLVLDLAPNRFQTLLQQPASASGHWVSVRAMLRAGDTLWVASQSGLDRVHLPTGRAERLTEGGVYAQWADRRGNRWVGGERLALLPGGRLPARTFELGNPHVWAIAEDPRGLLWLGTESGLTRFDGAKTREVPFTNYGRFPELATAKVTAFCPDPDGTWWVCASTGLYRLDPRTHRLTDRFHANAPDPAHRLPFDFLHHLCPDRQQPGLYWLATKGAGLVRWHRPSGQARVFARAEGLSNEVLHAVYDDGRGGLWLPSDRGLMRFDKQSLTVRAFFLKDGLSHEEFNVTAHHQAADGRLYFGGLNGVTSFHPREFYGEKAEAPPRLAVASLRRQEARTGLFADQSGRFWENQTVELSPGERAAELAVCLPDYRQPAYHTYAYRLRGLQEQWVYQPTNVITLSGLPAGSYTLEVKAQNSVGQWTPRALEIPVRMLPPVYLRWWFLGGVALVLIGLGTVLLWLRTRALRRENERLESEVATRTAKIQRQADELQELDRLKSRFFANVSHELRTPLTLILGSLHQLKNGRLPAPLSFSVEVAERNAGSLLRQVNQLLDLNRLEAHRLERRDAPVALRPFLKRVLANFASQAEQNGQVLRVDDHTAAALAVQLDAEKVETILVNLLANALKYTPPGGHVTLRADEQEDCLVLAVSDTGRGIHPDDLPRVFERFFQTTRPEAPAEGGSGIGLSLVSELTELLGGTVAVRSEVGTGSTFEVCLPKRLPPTPPAPEAPVPAGSSEADQPGAARTGNAKAASAPSASPRPRILLVEDHADMRAYVAGLLADEFEVQTAPNGTRAFEYLKTTAALPDLILSDRMMPGLDGLQLLEKLRAENHLPLVPFVMLTARAADADRLDALRAGVDDYLTKPFSPDELLARVRNLVRNARRRQQFLADADHHDPPTEPFSAENSAHDWLKKTEMLVRKHLAEPDFGVLVLAELLFISERQLNRRLRTLTGLSPREYLLEIRLFVVREYFESHPNGTWKEAGRLVGGYRPHILKQRYAERFGTVVAEFS